MFAVGVTTARHELADENNVMCIGYWMLALTNDVPYETQTEIEKCRLSFMSHCRRSGRHTYARRMVARSISRDLVTAARRSMSRSSLLLQRDVCI